jgi:hypothetical protein
MRRISTAIIAILMILFYCTGCGVNRQLNQAKKHLEKAERLGAKVTKDTTWNIINLKAPKMEFKTQLNDLCLTSAPIQAVSPDGRKKAIIRTDTITKTVYVECPEQEVTGRVATAIATNIETPLGLRHYLPRIGIPSFLLGAILFLFFGARIRDGPAGRFIINLGNNAKEKPP